MEAESNNLRDWVSALQSQMAAQAALKVESNTLPGWAPASHMSMAEQAALESGG